MDRNIWMSIKALRTWKVCASPMAFPTIFRKKGSGTEMRQLLPATMPLAKPRRRLK